MANRFHEEFHRKMVQAVLGVLSQEESVIFARALEAISGFFREEKNSTT